MLVVVVVVMVVTVSVLLVILAHYIPVYPSVSHTRNNDGSFYSSGRGRGQISERQLIST